jgi:hypothetical protein
MDFAKKNKIVASFLLGLASQLSGYSQTYYITAPLTSGIDRKGAPPICIQDANYTGMINLTWQTLTATVYLDPGAQTIRQVGFASVVASATNITFNENRQITNNFPNPPTIIPATVTVNIALAGGGFSFDTGPQPITWSEAAQAYTFDGDLHGQSFSYTGSYSLVTGGQTVTGTFNYSLPVTTWTTFRAFDRLTTENYPEALSLGGLGAWGYLDPGPVFATASATNGLVIQLQPLHCGQFDWGVIGPAIATNIASGPPTIISQPESVSGPAHKSVSFNVSAFGALPLIYQWSLNRTNIPSATTSTLTIPNVAQSDLGSYKVVVSNEFGVVTSSNAVLSMPPFLATPFPGAVTVWGKDATLAVQAWGTGPLAYQWFKDGDPVANGTNSMLNMTSMQFTNAGLYWVVVSSDLGSVTNAPAQVIVNPADVSLGLYPGVTIRGVAGYKYVIRRTTDLSNTNSWETMTHITLAEPIQLWIDTNSDASLPANAHHIYQVLPSQ